MDEPSFALLFPGGPDPQESQETLNACWSTLSYQGNKPV